MNFYTWWAQAWHGPGDLLIPLLLVPYFVWALSDAHTPWRLRVRQGLMRMMGAVLCVVGVFALWAVWSAGPYHLPLPVLFLFDR
jgi:hypothetical protein